MTPQEIEGLANALVRLGITQCELSDDRGGVAVKLVFRVESTKPTSTQPPTKDATAHPSPQVLNVLRSPGMGHFRSQHPFLDQSTVNPGQPIADGGLVGFLVAGPMISDIRATRSGVLGKQLVSDGQLVGFGDAVFDVS